MKRLTLCMLALLATMMLAGRANAQCSADFSFTTSASPNAFATASGNGVVTLLSQTLPVCTSCGSQIVLQNIATNSTDSSSSAVANAPVSYSSTLTITDTASGQSGTWTFGGQVSGSLSQTFSSIQVTSALTSSATLTLGCKTYTVTSVNVTNPGPQAGQPGGSLFGSIAATVTCTTQNCTPTVTKGSINPCYGSVADAEAAALAATTVTFPNGCTPTAPTVTTDGNLCPAKITVSASPSSNCGQAVSVDYSAYIITGPPQLSNVPSGGDLTPFCNPTPPSCSNSVTALDSCQRPLTVTCTDHGVITDGCLRHETFTYSATDCLGQIISQDVTNNWKVDTTGPAFDAPQNQDLGCNPATLPSCPNPPLTATDTCDGTVPVTCTPGNVVSDGCNRSQTFTFTATDSCGNVTTHTTTYTWISDTNPPTINCPGNLTPPASQTNSGGCVACIPIPVSASTCPGVGLSTITLTYTASDGSSGDLSTLSSDGGQTYCFNANVTYTITASVTDLCNNQTSTCQFTVTPVCQQATRTPGFWATHLWAVQQNLSCATQCGIVNPQTLGEVEAIFWGSISTNCDGSKRSKLGQARMQLGQQLIAAYLNVCVLGSTPTSFSLADACAAIQGTNVDLIKTYIGLVDAFNNSGDNIAFNFNQQQKAGSATPQAAQAAANKNGSGCIDPGTAFK